MKHGAKNAQIQGKYLTITMYTHTHARTHAPTHPHTHTHYSTANVMDLHLRICTSMVYNYVYIHQCLLHCL